MFAPGSVLNIKTIGRSFKIMAAVRLIGSLYRLSEAGAAAGQGWGGAASGRSGGRLAAPRESCWRELERAGRGRGGEPARGRESL